MEVTKMQEKAISYTIHNNQQHKYETAKTVKL